jgi:cell wall-associated NlpC family hydrolase
MKSALDRFLSAVLSQDGAPYVWAGKGESVAGRKHEFRYPNGNPRLVFDCSGLITWALKRCGWVPRVEMNAHRMWTLWRRTDKPLPGDVICYGTSERCSHVEVLLPDGSHFGALGGNSKTLAPTKGAAVQKRIKPRRDVLGYVTNPLRMEDAPPDSAD